MKVRMLATLVAVGLMFSTMPRAYAEWDEMSFQRYVNEQTGKARLTERYLILRMIAARTEYNYYKSILDDVDGAQFAGYVAFKWLSRISEQYGFVQRTVIFDAVADYHRDYARRIIDRETHKALIDQAKDMLVLDEDKEKAFSDFPVFGDTMPDTSERGTSIAEKLWEYALQVANK